MRPLLCLSLFSILGLFFACNSPLPSTSCSSGLILFEDVCRAVCDEFLSCGDGESCKQGVCIPCSGEACNEDTNSEECDPTTTTCSCEDGFSVASDCEECETGKILEGAVCVDDLCFEQDCNGNGLCQPNDGTCACFDDYEGDTCGSCVEGYFLNNNGVCEQTCENSTYEADQCNNDAATVFEILDVRVQSREVCSMHTGTKSCVFGARFGASVVTGDFDGNGLDDIAIGAPLQLDSGSSTSYVGSVYIAMTESIEDDFPVYSNLRRLRPQNVGRTPNNGELFGYSLASGDFNGDGFFDLAIGAPGANIDDKVGAGALAVVYGTENGLDFSDHQFFSQDSPGIPVVETIEAFEPGAESKDHFGFSLSAAHLRGSGGPVDLAIGSPGENIGGGDDANCDGVDGIGGSKPSDCSVGSVHILYGRSEGLDPEETAFRTVITSTSGDGGLTRQEGAYYGYALQGVWTDQVGGGICSPNQDGPCGDYQRLAIGEPGRVVVFMAGTAAVGTVYGARLHNPGSGAGLQRQETMIQVNSIGSGARLGAKFSAVKRNEGASTSKQLVISAPGRRRVYPVSDFGDSGFELDASQFESLCPVFGAYEEAIGTLVHVDYTNSGSYEVFGSNGDGSLVNLSSNECIGSVFEAENDLGYAMTTGDILGNGQEYLVRGAPMLKKSEFPGQVGVVRMTNLDQGNNITAQEGASTNFLVIGLLP